MLDRQTLTNALSESSGGNSQDSSKSRKTSEHDKERKRIYGTRPKKVQEMVQEI
jgi:hypothetical protein